MAAENGTFGAKTTILDAADTIPGQEAIYKLGVFHLDLGTGRRHYREPSQDSPLSCDAKRPIISEGVLRTDRARAS